MPARVYGWWECVISDEPVCMWHEVRETKLERQVQQSGAPSALSLGSLLWLLLPVCFFFPVPRLCGLASCMLARASTTFLPLRAHACTYVGTCAYSTCRRSRGNVNACIHMYALYGRTEKNEFRCARRGQRRLGTSHDDHRRLFPSALYFLGVVSRDSKNTLPLLTFGNYSPLTLVLLSRDLIYVFVCTLVEELLCFRVLLSMYLSTK